MNEELVHDNAFELIKSMIKPGLRLREREQDYVDLLDDRIDQLCRRVDKRNEKIDKIKTRMSNLQVRNRNLEIELKNEKENTQKLNGLLKLTNDPYFINLVKLRKLKLKRQREGEELSEENKRLRRSITDSGTKPNMDCCVCMGHQELGKFICLNPCGHLVCQSVSPILFLLKT